MVKRGVFAAFLCFMAISAFAQDLTILPDYTKWSDVSAYSDYHTYKGVVVREHYVQKVGDRYENLTVIYFRNKIDERVVRLVADKTGRTLAAAYILYYPMSSVTANLDFMRVVGFYIRENPLAPWKKVSQDEQVKFLVKRNIYPISIN